MEQLAGETTEDYIKRLESECYSAHEEARDADRDKERALAERENLQQEHDVTCERLEFLRAQLADLAINIASPSAPRRKGEMARLLEGLLSNQEWQNGAWRSRPPTTTSALAARIGVAVRKAFMEQRVMFPREFAASSVADRTLDILGLGPK
jgi:hypothetical protein